MNGQTTFVVFADLHVDIMHDAVARVEAVIQEAQRQNADFIIHLGDYMYPTNRFLSSQELQKRDKKAFICGRDDEKEQILELFRCCGVPLYHTLGNHEADACDKATSMAFLGLAQPYYSFDAGNFHFVVLDCNFIKTPQGYESYQWCNYHYHPADALPYLPHEQLAWLEKDLQATQKQTLLFSHQSLCHTRLGIQNHQELTDLLRQVNRDKPKVRLCINGHEHIDGMAQHEGVSFLSLNSIANIWLGSRYRHVRYSDAVDRDYPYLACTAPYQQPLFAVVCCKPACITITGRQSSFVGPSPYALGFSLTDSEYPSTPQIANYVVE